jgi:hypothetical protein
VSLREAAAQAWARHQAEVAGRDRQEIERAREHLIDSARHALRQLTYTLADPFSPFREGDVLAAEITVEGADEDLLYHRAARTVARIEFAGETFEWRPGPDDIHVLCHVWICPSCGERYDPPTWSHVVTSLADLGHWLEHAESLHLKFCTGGA